MLNTRVFIHSCLVSIFWTCKQVYLTLYPPPYCFQNVPVSWIAGGAAKWPATLWITAPTKQSTKFTYQKCLAAIISEWLPWEPTMETLLGDKNHLIIVVVTTVFPL